MDSRLATHQQLANKPQQMTKQSVHSLFKQQVSKGKNNKNNALQIMNILGGIDNILDEFLSQTNKIHIDQVQLNQLHQLFVTPQKYQQQNRLESVTKLNSLHNDNQEIYGKYDEMCYTFFVENTYFNSIWGKEKEKLAAKLMDAMRHKIIHLIYIFSWILYFSLRFGGFRHYIIFPLYTLIVPGFFCHFYIVTWLLCANKKGIHLLMTTFEFWFKFIYIVCLVIILMIDEYVLIEKYIFNHKILRIIAYITAFSNLIFAVIIVSVFDALNINRISKVLFSGTIAAMFTMYSIYLQYITYFNGDNYSVVPVLDDRFLLSLSLKSILINISEILAIFSWKQTFLTIIRKHRCVLIKYSPYIEWVHGHNGNHKNKSYKEIQQNNNMIQTVNVDPTDIDNMDKTMNTNKYLPNQQTQNELELNDLNINSVKTRNDSISSTESVHESDSF